MRIEETELTPVFIDVETYVDDEVTLKKQTLRKYLASTYMTALAVAIGRGEPEVMDFKDGEPDDYGKQVLEALKTLALDPTVVFVAHNAAFDIRVLRFLLQFPQPCNVWCTQEGAMGAWPDLQGGYKLFNCGVALKLNKRKFEIHLGDLGKLRSQAVRKQNGVPWAHVKEDMQDSLKAILASVDKHVPVYVTEDTVDEVLKIYNKRDVEVMQELYYRQVEVLPDVEKRIALMTHRVRRNHFKIGNERLEVLLAQLHEAAKVAESSASKLLHAELDEDTAETALKDIFNDTTGNTESIRYLRLRKVINDKMGAPELKSTSLKKLNPVMLAPHQNVANLLEQTSRVSKLIFHRRRAQVFRDMDEVDVELGYMRAITGRFSSPSSGAGGLNLHNCPKHDKLVAKPVRQLFRVPDYLCLVRGDLANVEYRCEGKLTSCRTITTMFESNVLADPYCEAWKAMTGQVISKAMPIRQVSKAAVLGLGFLMSATGYAKVLLKAISTGDVSYEMLRAIAKELSWMDPGKAVDQIVSNVGCERIIGLAAYHIHKSFNGAHPEFNMTGEWLLRCVNAVVSAHPYGSRKFDQARTLLDQLRTSSSAPDPNLIYVDVDKDESFEFPSLRITCGPWVPTLCWRSPRMMRSMINKQLTENRLCICKASGLAKPFTKQLAIENVTQAAARNALCDGLIKLEKLGYQDILHVHDEIMLLVPKERNAVLKARDDLLSVFGPSATGKPMGWAVLIKPDEVSVTQSLYEDEDDLAKVIKNKKTGETRPGGDRWGKIERNEADCLLNLP